MLLHYFLIHVHALNGAERSVVSRGRSMTFIRQVGFNLKKQHSVSRTVWTRLYIKRGYVPGQWCDFAPLLDAEAPEAVGPPQCGEALVGHAGCPGDELQQAETLLVVEVLHGGPEPTHHDVTIMVAWELTRDIRVSSDWGLRFHYKHCM